MGVVVTTQTIFQRLHLKLSDSIADSVTDYTQDGKTIKASKRTQSLNDSIRSIYERLLSTYLQSDKLNGYNNFVDDYQSFRDTRTIIITAGVPLITALPKDVNVRKYLNGMISDRGSRGAAAVNVRLMPFLNEEQYISGLTNPDSNYKPTAANPRFWEKAQAIEVQGINLAYASILWTVLLNPVNTDINTSGPDVIVSETWEPEILNTASQICLSFRQA